MTEEEWLEYAMPGSMLGFIGDRSSARKLHLFTCESVELIWRMLLQREVPASLELAWAMADGQVSQPELAATPPVPSVSQPEMTEHYSRRAFEAAFQSPGTRTAEVRTSFEALAVKLARDNGQDTAIASQAARTAMATVLRCIFGNPFRPVAVNPAWLTPTVTTLAGQMYDARDFSAMPILADALQDTGCDDAAVLTHCREPGPHARGCWVVDLLTGRA